MWPSHCQHASIRALWLSRRSVIPCESLSSRATFDSGSSGKCQVKSSLLGSAFVNDRRSQQ